MKKKYFIIILIPSSPISISQLLLFIYIYKIITIIIYCLFIYLLFHYLIV